MANTLKRVRSTSISSERGGTVAPPTTVTAQNNKKRKLPQSSVLQSPFPTLIHPTIAEAREVYVLLCAAHGTPGPAPPVETPLPNILEGLISTILSQSTSGSNSSRAKAGLDAAFGRNNFSAIADASQERVVEAIRCGGLAKKKANTIQKVLSTIHTRHRVYSLQFLASKTDDLRKTDAEVTAELLSYPGVGPKTAACVMSLCLGREAFAVDTHVWRLSKVLGWVPSTADRVLTQAHLEERLPGDLKLGLHVLMMRHGRACMGCKKSDGGACILNNHRRARTLPV
ncbi:DNA glycosylase [Mycena rosella]|uniref:DNA glycosylase n=1 Tax=Mycena rosella TaxID=1033263 RepID=A0AAD7CNL4_MYCRO|nr:DNA glycosylase [Mycena rosella]